MTWFTGLLTYLLVWWVVLFAVLPWGIRHDHQDTDPEGRTPGAPLNPLLKKKFLITTGVAAVIWGIIYLIVLTGWIDFTAISLAMRESDLS